MKLNKILFGTFMIATVGLMCACSSDDDNGGGGNNNQQEREKEVKGEMKKAELLGFVKDTNGNPLAGVQVGSGTAVTTTDASGAFALTDIEVVKGRTVVDFSKEGYFDVVRSYDQADKAKWEVVMVSKSDTKIADNATYASASAQTLKTNAGMEVKMPADGYKDAKTGKDYTGTVKSEMLYLNPDDENFATMMPGGDLAAVNANNETVQLISYGMTKVEMTDQNGNPLQLKDGKEAQLTFPIPESLKDNTPASIPLWSFNESTGLWEEEGSATLQNGVYVGTVKHFSWVNLDYPEKRVTCIITVKTKKGTLVPWVVIQVDGQTTCMTNAQGVAQCYIPANTDVKIWVNSEDYGGYSPVVSTNIPGAAGGTTVNQTLTLPELAHIKGKVVNQDGSNLATVWIEYNGNQTKYYVTDFDGSFNILSPSNYKGQATLKIRAANGQVYSKNFEITGNDVDLGEVEVNAKIDPSKTQGGTIYVTTDNKKNYELPITINGNNPLSGATIIDNHFYVVDYDMYTQEGDWNNPDFQMIRWVISSDQYDRASGTAIGQFFYAIEGQTGQTFAEVNQANYEVNVNGKQVVINMNGRGVMRVYTPEDTEWEDIDYNNGNAVFTGAGLTFNLVESGETKKPLTKAYAPSFMPFPSAGEYPIGLVITGFTYFTKGVQAYMGGDRSAFDKLVSWCDANLKGWEKYDEDDDTRATEDGEDAGFYFYNKKEGKLVVLEFDSWAQTRWNDELVANATSAYDIDSPIYVSAIEGLSMSPEDLMEMSDNYYYSPRRAIAKAKTMSKLSPFYRK